MIVLILLFLLFLILLIHITRLRLTSPAGVYAVSWGLFVFCAVVFFPKEYPVKYSGIIWMIFAIYAYVIGYGLASKKCWKNDSLKLVNEEKTLPCISWNLVVTYIIISFVPVAYSVYKSGVSVNSLFNFSMLQQVSHQNAIIRYSGEEEFSTFEQICNSFCSVTPFVCGYSLNYAVNKNQKILCISSILPILLQVILTNAKLGLVTYSIIFFIGYYISYSYKYSRHLNINLKMLRLIILLSAGLFLMFYLSFVLRIGGGKTNIHSIIMDKLMIYAFGHIQSFSCWFDNKQMNLADLGLGVNTFLAISSRLGLAVKVQGIYGIIPGAVANVYTPFRALIEDYGTLGSLVIVFINGFLSRVSYNTIMYARNRTTIVQCFFAILMFSNMMFFVSIWTYTTYILAMLFWCIFLYDSFSAKK